MIAQQLKSTSKTKLYLVVIKKKQQKKQNN